jgi:hypothetical protein
LQLKFVAEDSLLETETMAVFPRDEHEKAATQGLLSGIHELEKLLGTRQRKVSEGKMSEEIKRRVKTKNLAVRCYENKARVETKL